MFVGHRRGGRDPGLGTDPKEAPGPWLDGVGLSSDSNGYGSDIEEGDCTERRRGTEKPHHGLQVDITTSPSSGGLNLVSPASCSGHNFSKMITAEDSYLTMSFKHVISGGNN